MIAECLDCIFDVFGSDDHNAVLKELGLVQKLKELLPLYKEKVKHNIGHLTFQLSRICQAYHCGKYYDNFHFIVIKQPVLYGCFDFGVGEGTEANAWRAQGSCQHGDHKFTSIH